MDGNFLCAARRHNGGLELDRISQLPQELILVILSFLPLRDAVKSSILSSRWLHLWKHTPNINLDRISQLPDQLIVFILSFLPLTNAAATTVLSSRWSSDLWKHTPNLDFGSRLLTRDLDLFGRGRDSWDVERSKQVQLVDSVLQSSKAVSLKEFNIYLYMDKSAHAKLGKWVGFVFSKQLESLTLRFNCHNSNDMVVVEELLRESKLCRPENLTLLKSLKSLSLKSCRVSGEDIKLFLGNCPLLEVLVIRGAQAMSDLEICGATLVLKKLDLHCLNSYDISVKISAPNLTWLRVNEAWRNVLLENVTKLVGADISFLFRGPKVVKDFASAVFCFSSQLKILNLTFRSRIFFDDVFPQFPNLEKLDVEYCGGKVQSLLPVTALVWASPRLEEFKLLYKKKSGVARPEAIRNIERSLINLSKCFSWQGFWALVIIST